jgi:pimeloyl-ACP methyl ester carboxylesterase
MRNILIAYIRRLLAVVLFALTLNAQPVLAQISGDSPDYLTATFSAKYARYYAPYALQAAAAYMGVKRLDATLDPSGLPPGSDVQRAVAYVTKDNKDETLIANATNYLRAWRYQFGSERYLECYESDPDCLMAIKKDRYTRRLSVGPAFHVWARTGYPQKDGPGCSEVSIAFRGTDAYHGYSRLIADGITNADTGSGYVYDTYYRQLRRNIDAIIRKITRLPCYKAGNSPQIVSVGHSLGGGLAQIAALANNSADDPGLPRIAKVFTFDPTPITGASYVDESVRVTNAKGLEIDRIYQTGEFLQPLRQLLQQFPDSSAPCVRNVIFDASRGNGLKLHSMSALANGMVKVTYKGKKDRDTFLVPEELTRCPKPRYHPPAPYPDEELAPDGSFLISVGGSATKVATAGRGRAMDSYAMAGGFGVASPPLVEMNGAVAPKNARRSGASMGKRTGGTQALVVQAASEAAWPPG